uniref:Uncharacterized protein n=1 Tax=Anguilla anguilla TaxID=7936 RepID=A0A0E9P9Z7_ANGAN
MIELETVITTNFP